jgi:cytochrome c-type biogenesis protein CcmH/NrfG
LISLISLISLSILAAQATSPTLPPLALDAFPPAARQLIEATQRAAAARPNDANAVGALARALHAWEQWHAAHEAYSRAASLSPKTFEWHYLDAVVLQRLARHGDAASQLRIAALR